MSTLSRPHGYSAVSAYLVVPGAQAVIDFAVTTFGAIALRRFDLMLMCRCPDVPRC